MRLRIAVLVALLVFALPSAGCSVFAGEEAPEEKVAGPGATVRGDLPEDVPAKLPLWPGSEVLEGSSSEQAYEVVLSTSDDFDLVLKGLAAGFDDEGWEIVEEPLGEGEERVTMLSVTNSDSEGFITLTQDASQTVISYVVTPAQD